MSLKERMTPMSNKWIMSHEQLNQLKDLAVEIQQETGLSLSITIQNDSLLISFIDVSEVNALEDDTAPVRSSTTAFTYNPGLIRTSLQEWADDGFANLPSSQDAPDGDE